VTFVDPDSAWMKHQGAFLDDNAALLDLPAEGGSNAPLSQWLQYGGRHKQYLQNKSAYLKAQNEGMTPDLLWDGDGHNDNATLTIFRHYDHASVVKGLVGDHPTTAYVVDYALMERITYLIVSGFDLFGGISHQLQTRMYMDFLRMEGEYNFLLLLPAARRGELVDTWYRGLDVSTTNAIKQSFADFPNLPQVHTTTATPEHEIFTLIEKRLDKVRSRRFDPSSVKDAAVRAALVKLGAVKGKSASFMPELSFVEVTGGTQGPAWLTVARDSAHSNVAQIFDEDKRRLVDEDDLTAVPGFLGAYPEAFFKVPRDELDDFTAAVTMLDSARGYGLLRKRWGVLRNNPDFWQHSDVVRDAAHALDPIGAGLFDYSRLDPQ
jgi:hypothetical protein